MIATLYSNHNKPSLSNILGWRLRCGLLMYLRSDARVRADRVQEPWEEAVRLADRP